MSYKLSTSVKVGNKILLDKWYKVLSVEEDGVTTKKGKTLFGETIFGWKYK